MNHCHRVRALVNLNTLYQLSSLSTPKCGIFLQPIFFSTTSQSDQQQSFTISYLTKHCGLSPQAALRAFNRVCFDTAQKPDSVIAFFREQGFSSSHIQTIITRAPELLICDHIQRCFASTHDIVTMVARRPYFLCRSLEKFIIPTYELVRRFFPSGARPLQLVCFTYSGNAAHFTQNLKLLLDVGVTHTNIGYLLKTRPSILYSSDFIEAVEEVKGLGFHPRKKSFIEALQAKKAVSKSRWDAKIDALRKWGWSEDAISQSFRRHPALMLRSKDKLNAVMSFWVGQLGWDSSTLQAHPVLFGYNLKKRIIPRASVIQCLLSVGLLKNDASLVAQFKLTDKMFMKKFVTCFGEEETSRLLKLYQPQAGG